MHIEIFKGSGVQPWRFRLVAANGETVAQSEGYLTRWNVQRAVRKALPGIPVHE